MEAMESSQPEIVAYHERVEEGAKRKDEEEAACKAVGRRNARSKKGTNHHSFNFVTNKTYKKIFRNKNLV